MALPAIETTPIVLGIVQGVTEFLPISSSGHLVLFQHLFGMKEPELLLDISLHFGTLMAIVFVFKVDLVNMVTGAAKGFWFILFYREKGLHTYQEERRWLGLILWSTVPTAFVGFFFRSFLEALFANLTIVAGALIITGFMLWSTRGQPVRKRNILDVRYWDAFLIGLIQAVAITPGISRSGATISLGLILGLQQGLAARYSFLLSIPAICGAMAVEALSSPSLEGQVFSLIIGTLVAALFGYGALRLLLRIVQKGGLHFFSPYLWALGLIVLGASLF